MSCSADSGLPQSADREWFCGGAGSGRPGRAVQLWWIDTQAQPAEAQRQYLPAAEWQRAERFRSSADRCRFVACRAVLRRVLGDRLGVAPAEIELTEGTYGKPRLADERAAAQWSFNVAHAGQLGCVALAAGPPLGVDVERIRLPHNLPLMIDKILTPGEQEALRRVPPDQQLAAFFQFWTCKEAVAKATGRGLRLPLDQIAVDLQGGGPVAIRSPGAAATEYYMQPLPAPRTGYAAAVALEGEEPLTLIVGRNAQPQTGDSGPYTPPTV